MATEELIAGNQSTYASLMTTELNSLASGSAVYGGTTIANGTNVDLFAEFSFTSGGSITPTGAPFLALYLYPLNGDGTTYGDGRFAAATAAQPPSNYYRGFCGLVASAGTAVGTFAIPGTSNFFIPLPRGTFRPVLYNGSGVALSASGNILYWRSTNLTIA